MAKRLVGTKGLQRSQYIKFFHDSYACAKDIRNSNGSIFMYSTNPQRYVKTYPEYGYLNRALSLCLNSDICQKLGMSLVDFMYLDLATFTYIEEQYTKSKEEEAKKTGSVLKEMNLPTEIAGHKLQ